MMIDDHLVEIFPLLAQGATSAGRRQESGCCTHDPAASTKSGSRLGLGQGFWLATEME